jgi:hypothetical protein
MTTPEQKQNAFVPYDETSKRALVCDANPASQKLFVAALAALQLKPEAASTIDQVMEGVKYNQYDVVIINDQFSLNPRGENETIAFFHELPMSARRTMLIALVGESLTTLDNLAAFGHGVNLVVNSRDIKSLPAILAKTVADDERFFRAIRETQSWSGKH